MNGVVRFRTRLAVLALLIVCAGGWSGVRAAEPPPAAGRFLVAVRGQLGLFSRSVVLLIVYGPDGALGLIVNHPTKFKLFKLIPGVKVKALRHRDDPVYLGGPVSLARVTLLVRAKSAPPDAIHVVGDIYASESMKTLRAIVGNKQVRFRGYAGYAGWAPGQLDDEIARGGWHVIPADPDDVFSTDPAGLWNKLIHRPSLQLVKLPQRPYRRGPPEQEK